MLNYIREIKKDIQDTFNMKLISPGLILTAMIMTGGVICARRVSEENATILKAKKENIVAPHKTKNDYKPKITPPFN